MQLNLFNALRLRVVLALLKDLSRARIDTPVGVINIILEELPGLVILSRDAVFSLARVMLFSL